MILAFDIGGSRIKAGVFDGTRLVPLGETPTPARDAPGRTLIANRTVKPPSQRCPRPAPRPHRPRSPEGRTAAGALSF